MCDPVTIGGAILSVAGAGLNAAAQSRVESARNDALAAERIRQQGFDQEATALNTQSQDRYQGFEQKQAEKATTLGDYFKGQQAELPPAASAAPASSSNLTVQNEAKARGEAKARTDEVGGALGNLRAFGDVLGSNQLLQARDASKIGQIGGFKRASSALLPGELEAANSAGGNLKLFGDIAGGLGRVGVSAGLGGAGGGLANMFSSGNTVASAGAAGSRALGGAIDRASVPGYAGYSAPNIFSMFGR